ncbi:acyl-CoA thioesterase [Salarchaeum japonicum]|uniref:acyl-CoA thioesterase n=1 Tax=Salarchaeum japonicum TaxID=555573 RepID=UPI003C70B051
MPSVMETYVENREMVQPNHANTHGTAHGGNVMKWMDEIGAMSAMRFAGEEVVTARMNQVNFDRPIPVGDTALIEAYVYAAGSTSMRVRLRAFRENPRTSECEQTTESYFVYVAVNDEGRPTTVPDLIVETAEGEEYREVALEGEGE